MKTLNKIKNLFLTSFIAFTLIHSSLININAASDTSNTAVLSVEAFSADYGFVLNPTEIVLNGNEKLNTILDRHLESQKINNGSGAQTYINSIAVGTEFLNILSEISTRMENENITYTENVAKDGWLSEFDYTKESGWIVIVNNSIIKSGIADYTPAAGDVIRVVFSIYGYGADLAVDANSSGLNSKNNVFEVTNRDSLLTAMAHYYANSDFDMDNYIENIVIDLNSKQSDIDDAHAFMNGMLDEIENSEDDDDSTDDVESDGDENTDETTTATDEPDNQTLPSDFEEDEPSITTVPTDDDIPESTFQEYINNIPKAESAPTGVAIPALSALFISSAIAVISIKYKKK